MNPLILIGFDVAFSAVLILLVLYLSWNRLGPVPEAPGIPAREPVPERTAEKAQGAETLAPEGRDRDAQVGDMTSRAQSLRRQGLSVEQIASRLQSPRGEIEMLLALSDMGRGVEGTAPEPVLPVPKRKITEMFRF
jgi:hypothetical protein